MTRSQLHNIIVENIDEDDKLFLAIKQKYDKEWVKNFIVEKCKDELTYEDAYVSSFWVLEDFYDHVLGFAGDISSYLRNLLRKYLVGIIYDLDEKDIIDIESAGNDWSIKFKLSGGYIDKEIEGFDLNEGAFLDDEAEKLKFFENLVIDRIAEEPAFHFELREELWYKGQRWLKEFDDAEDPGTYRYIDKAIDSLYKKNIITKDHNNIVRLTDEYIEDQTIDFNLDESKMRNGTIRDLVEKVYSKNSLTTYFINQLAKCAVDNSGINYNNIIDIPAERIKKLLRKREGKTLDEIANLYGYERFSKFIIPNYIKEVIDEAVKNKIILKDKYGWLSLPESYFVDQVKDFNLDESKDDVLQTMQVIKQKFDKNRIEDYIVKALLEILSHDEESSPAFWSVIRNNIARLIITSTIGNNRSISNIQHELSDYLDDTLLDLQDDGVVNLDIKAVHGSKRIYTVKLSDKYLSDQTKDFSLDEIRSIVKDIIIESSDIDWDRFYKHISDKLVNYLNEDIVVAAIVENPITFHNADGTAYMPDVRRELEIKVANEMFKNWDMTHDNTWMNDRSFMKSISTEIIQSEIRKIIEKLINDKVIIFAESEGEDPYREYAKVNPDYIENQTKDFSLDESLILEESNDKELLNTLYEYLGNDPEDKIIKTMFDLREQGFYAAAGKDGAWAVSWSTILYDIINNVKSIYKIKYPHSSQLNLHRCQDLFKPVMIKIVTDLVDKGILEKISHYVMLTDKYYKDQVENFNLDESVEKEDKVDVKFNELKSIYTPDVIENIIIDKLTIDPEQKWAEFVLKDFILKKIFYTRVPNKAQQVTDYFHPQNFFGQNKIDYIHIVGKYVNSIFARMKEKNIIIRDDVYGDVELTDNYVERQVKDFSLD